MSRLRPFVGIFLFLVALPLFAGSKDCGDISITSFTANDAKTGEVVTINWSYSGAAPTSQTLVINDWNVYPIDSVDARSHMHLPTHAGNYKIRLEATSECGSASATTTFKVENCSITEPKISLSTELLQPFDTLDARIHLPSGYTVTWQVLFGGKLLSASGETARFQVDSHGPLQFIAVVTSRAGCTVTSFASVDVDRELCAPGIAPKPDLWGACTGQPTGAELWEPVPEGATVVWHVDGGEILDGQGTDRVTYVVNGTPGDLYTLSAYLQFPDGCSSWKVDQPLPVLGPPNASIDFDSNVIHAGESTTVYLTADSLSSWSFYAENGDSLDPLPKNDMTNVFPHQYTSSHGPGTSTIRLWAIGTCGGIIEKSTTIEILP